MVIDRRVLPIHDHWISMMTKNHLKTYLVLPHFDAGLLTPEDLEHLAALARKYKIPKTKITGGQRIAFLGMEEEAMASLREELNFAEYFPQSRNRVCCVQACPGKTWCNYGHQDALGLVERVGDSKGWRFTFGGNAAGRPRIGDVVADQLSADEAVELVRKTLNYYLQEAKFKSRSARFMERLGLEKLKRAVLG
jgi:NAD(P)H-nitrite reductase large subunit